MRKTLFPKGTLVYRHEDGHYPVYVVMSHDGGKFSLALPWQPSQAVLREVDPDDLERVFNPAKRRRRVSEA